MAGRRIITTLTVRDWELLAHAVTTAAAQYRKDSPGHEGVSDELDELKRRLTKAWNDGINVTTDRP